MSQKFLPFLHFNEKHNPVPSEISHMMFELAALHGELYRIYNVIEDGRWRSNQEHFSAELETGGDRVINGCLIVALASLPYLDMITQFYTDNGECGVFTYDHIELAKPEEWVTTKSLAAEIWRELGKDNWYSAAENNTVNLNELNFIIHYWAEKNVKGFKDWFWITSEEKEVVKMRHEGVITASPEFQGFTFEGGAKYQWDEDQVFYQDYKDGQIVWEHMNHHKLSNPTCADIVKLVLFWVGLGENPAEPQLPVACTPDDELSPEALEERYSPMGDGEHPEYHRGSWRSDVMELETTSGYWMWVAHKLRAD